MFRVSEVPGFRALAIDVRFLAALVNLTTAAQVLEIASDVFGDRVNPAARFFVEEVFQQQS